MARRCVAVRVVGEQPVAARLVGASEERVPLSQPLELLCAEGHTAANLALGAVCKISKFVIDFSTECALTAIRAGRRRA